MRCSFFLALLVLHALHALLVLHVRIVLVFYVLVLRADLAGDEYLPTVLRQSKVNGMCFAADVFRHVPLRPGHRCRRPRPSGARNVAWSAPPGEGLSFVSEVPQCTVGQWF